MLLSQYHFYTYTMPTHTQLNTNKIIFFSRFDAGAASDGGRGPAILRAAAAPDTADSARRAAAGSRVKTDDEDGGDDDGDDENI